MSVKITRVETKPEIDTYHRDTQGLTITEITIDPESMECHISQEYDDNSTSVDKWKYSFRAECSRDVRLLLDYLFDYYNVTYVEIKTLPNEFSVLPDRECIIEVDLKWMAMQEAIEKITDGHVMARTLNLMVDDE